MTEHAFHALARTLGRRHAVQAFTAAAATTLSGVRLAGAKSNKNKKKQQKKKIDQQALALCAAQVSQCQTVVGPGSQTAECCSELADCDFSGFIACLETLP